MKEEILHVAQELIQTQQQRQEAVMEQQQRLSAQQVMVVRMLEMPIAALEQNIQAEMQENPALEAETPEADGPVVQDSDGPADSDQDETFEQQQEKEEKQDELDQVLDQLDSDDRLEASNYERQNNHDPDADQEERVWGSTESFYDTLREQIGELELTERQQTIMEYLIGSLDSDGLLRKDLLQLSDELAIREYMDCSEDEIQHCIDMLQTFDPAGIGAQSLQQCLLIQILRKKPSHTVKLMHRVVNDHFGDFTHRRWDRIEEALDISHDMAEEVLRELRKLNPRPGAALGETMGRNTEQVTPDFIVDIDNDGNISFTLNQAGVPELYVSADFVDMIDTYRQNPNSMTRKDKEALLYAQQKVNRARLYIDAIRQRQHTMRQTMKSLIALQRDYFISGDEWDLKPMILKDVADRAGVDISTVSRVCQSKYAETPWGIIQLKSLFSNAVTGLEGEDVSTRRIKNALRQLIRDEEPGHPLSDIKLAAKLKEMGLPIARRTVAKYREQMGIAPSSMR